MNIYKITNEDDQVYIGSTSQPIKKRFLTHKSAVKQNISKCSLKHFNMDTAKLELVEQVSGSKRDMLFREKYHIENTECVNVNRPIVTDEERKQKANEARAEWIANVGLNTYQCSCGSTIQIRETARHQKTSKHLNFINSQN